MSLLSPKSRLVLFLLLAAIGLWLFFANAMQVLDADIGILGSVLIAVAAWASVGVLEDLPRSEGEVVISPGEWQAWIGAFFMAAIWTATLQSIPAFNVPLPIGQNHLASAAGRNIGVLIIVWVILSQVLKSRWSGQVTSDERDRWIEQKGASWGRTTTSVAVVAIAILLGFSPASRLQELNYPALAQMLMASVLLGFLVDYLVIAALYWRDRREASQ